MLISNSSLSKAHPWHGISPGSKAPEVITAFIEITPYDTIKYEVDKDSGFLKIDRPQKYSNVVPALYGFVPRTWCGPLVADFAMQQTDRDDIIGDGDPVDVIVLAERPIQRHNILLSARPVGGLRMLDQGEADDKIIAVLVGDAHYANVNDVNDLPDAIIDRLRHYFLTYKSIPGEGERKVEITHVYGKDEAQEVIRRSIEDYRNQYLKP